MNKRIIKTPLIDMVGEYNDDGLREETLAHKEMKKLTLNVQREELTEIVKKE